MTLKEIYEKLEKMEGGEALRDVLKEEVSKLNEEAKTQREGKESAEAKVQEVSQALEDLKKAKEGEGNKSKTQIEKMQEQLDKITTQLDEANKAATAEKEKRQQADILAQTVSALTKENARDPQEFAKLLVGGVTVNDDGTYSMKDKEGKSISIEDGTKGWLADHAWAIKNTQNGGSGGPDNSNNGGGNAVSLHAAIQNAMKTN